MSLEYLTTVGSQNIEANSMQEVRNFHFIDSLFECKSNIIQLGQNNHKDILLDKTIPLGPIEFEQTIKNRAATVMREVYAIVSRQVKMWNGYAFEKCPGIIDQNQNLSNCQ
uniref:Uncharacterized protein n=1 Tax=Glossina pallidipes TaxID=7398 RepID=A0A1A9ZPX7_GLOPL